MVCTSQQKTETMTGLVVIVHAVTLVDGGTITVHTRISMASIKRQIRETELDCSGERMMKTWSLPRWWSDLQNNKKDRIWNKYSCHEYSW
jgi:hypothetical protein